LYRYSPVRVIAKQWLAPKPAIVKIEAADKSAEDGKKSSAAVTDVSAGGKQDAPALGDNSTVEQTVHVCAVGTPYKLKCSRPITRIRPVTTLGSYIK
jgi:hypothetical protein